MIRGLVVLGPWLGWNILLLVVHTLVVWLLWNSILPHVSPVSSISLLQAVGLLLLGMVLSGRFWIQLQQQPKYGVRDNWYLRWKQMSEEERNALLNNGA